MSDYDLKAYNIIEAVSQFYGVTYDEMKMDGRKHEFVFAKQVAMYILQKKMSKIYSLQEIGDFFLRDHATVLHAIKVINGYIQSYQLMKIEVCGIMDRFKESYAQYGPKTEPLFVQKYDNSNVELLDASLLTD
jgi:chromosomal replication initiator protein